ncbi:hypothetical protein, unlikely [Trypanosoma brucei gambiense DAL972]|uniref:Uncharacterized protein n=1 Tax=Trypanosoma brucei gambiense (strain MHOM/CI/86/DAL972) TaxID=679716 RepID=C9ZST8_TRYB9|nr:hypothetical protein, unlikely [Trypanosoma brucei gambiense DAL972]CBH12473.1 hypothetical protein, unlikely [Trypanosoma brucei gambiense DAL972]|eukprot:XP_011774753.1 hypothetical protein, unlikely [Trypanosoma brucei gambiense DAL972]
MLDQLSTCEAFDFVGVGNFILYFPSFVPSFICSLHTFLFLNFFWIFFCFYSFTGEITGCLPGPEAWRCAGRKWRAEILLGRVGNSKQKPHRDTGVYFPGLKEELSLFGSYHYQYYCKYY